MDDELAALLKEAASSEKKSVNQFVLETLKSRSD
jgi:predicted HicB family RNase H-like nuclease